MYVYTQIYDTLLDNSICVMKTKTGEIVQRLPRSRSMGLVFSPANGQIASWENYAVKKGQVGEGAPNVIIWSVATGEELTSWINKSFDGWTPQWTADELWCLRGVANEVHFYNARDYPKGVVKKCVLKGMSHFQLAPGEGSVKLAAFVPSIKGAPASVRLYQSPHFDKPLCNKSFYKAEKITMVWNPQGDACLVNAATETDTTGKSYYGETNLYYMAIQVYRFLISYDPMY